MAKPGSFRLSPPPSQIAELERDYRAMRDMFYREPPEFDEVLRALQALEGEINSIQKADVFRVDGVPAKGI